MQLERLWRRDDVAVREKALWRLLYETAARAGEVLSLNVEDVELENRRARVRSKVYFPEKPANGVIVIQPSANQSINAATTCKVETSSSFGVGVHCDIYSNRF